MEILWTELANQDLEKIDAYISKNNPNAGIRTILKIFEKAEVLKKHSDVGRKGRIKNTRELVLNKMPYILVYRIRKQSVEVLRVFHTSKKWPPKILFPSS